MKHHPSHIIIYWTMIIIVYWAIITIIMIFPGPDGIAHAGQDSTGHPSIFSAPLSASKNVKAKTTLLTLARAKEIALENSPSLASAMERVNQARETAAQARAAYFPTLSASAGLDYNENTSGIGYDENLYTSALSASQTLFDGFYRKYSNLSARYSEKMSLAARDEARRLLSWSVAQTFLNIQLTLDTINIARADMDFNQKQEIEAIAKEKSGTGSYSDVLNFKTQVNQAKSTLLDARQNLNEYGHGLAALLGYKDACLPAGMAVAPLMAKTLDLGLSKETAPEPDQDMETLLAQRPDLNKAFLAVQDAEANIHMKEASYLPTITLTFAYGTTTGSSFDDTDSMGASLGINASIDIFSGGIRKSKIRQARAEKRELEQDLMDAKITAKSNIRAAAQSISTARQQLALQKENSLLVETTRDLVEKEYAAGQVSLVRLNEAQNNMVSAMGDLSMARVSLVLALEAFDYYSGCNTN